MTVIWIIIAGFLSGIISGMGIGGGAILIPALTFLIGMEQKNAQCTNLMYFIPTAVFALIVHIKNKNVEIKSAVSILIFAVIGAIMGGIIAVRLESGLLKKLFGTFLAVLAVREIYIIFKEKRDAG
ncbi:MAG: sulfite exporter TauE/SafE family protein [Oscillospiraceae bacterium]|nr:sulfite exporter TauE/SafE family protein [Oscillospiraceae bacterium]